MVRVIFKLDWEIEKIHGNESKYVRVGFAARFSFPQNNHANVTQLTERYSQKALKCILWIK